MTLTYITKMPDQGGNAVLNAKYGAGPHGLGDPKDLSLRKVEMEVLIPKKMREIARIEKCVEEVEQFSACCKNSSLLMVVSCRKENDDLKKCLTKWYEDDEFKQRCTKEYLAERSAYRTTGITKKRSDTRLPNTM